MRFARGMGVAIAALMSFAVCFGQALNTSQLSGVVQDPTGAAVPGAQVTATKVDTGVVRTTKANSAGNYTFPDLPVGPYKLEVVASGFATFIEDNIRLEVGSNPEINPKMTLGDISQQVTVESTPGVTVETQSNGVGQVIDSKQIVELPLNGRDPTQLIALAGATTTAPAGDLNTNKNFPTITIAVAGGLPNGVAYVLDGGSHNDVFNNLNLPIPFPDALQEFKVETSSLPAQYGNHASAAVNSITRSGGNKFHGALFEFVRNYKFNAANFFGYNAATGIKTRDNLKRNQFGGTIGGPILHNKLFFFAGAQDTIIRATGSPTTVFAPTQDMLNGDFTVAINYKNPATGLNCFNRAPGTPSLTGGFVGNKINPASYNQQALNIIKAGIPVTNDAVNNPCGATNVILSQNSTSQQVIGRVDYNQSEKHSLFVRYFIARFNSPVTATTGNLLTVNQVNQLNQVQAATIGDNYTITPNIVNSVRLTGNRTLGLRSLVPFFDPSSVGINAYTKPSLAGFMGITVTNGFSLGQGGNNPGYFNSTKYQLVDDVIVIRGQHQIAFGGNYIFAYMNTVNNRPTNGAYTFSGAITGGNTVGYADFLTGNVGTFQQGNADYENDVYHYAGAYVQDSWKARPNLTLNYGLRWEPYIPFWNRNSHAENFSVDRFNAGTKSVVYPNAPAGLIFPGDTGFPGRSYNAGKLNQFAPRIGFIFDPSNNGSMSIRGGYGIFYDTPQLFFDTRYSNAPPWGQTITLAGVNLTNPWATYPGGNPFPAANVLTPNTTFVQQGTYVNTPIGYKPQYLQQYNLSIQKEKAGWLLSASYLGNKTTHLTTAYEANPALYIPGVATATGGCGILTRTTGLPAAGAPCSNTTNTNFRRALYQANPAQGIYYATIGQLDDGGIANYNGLLVSANRRGRSVNLVANYTYAHCLSEAATTELTGPSYVIPGNRHASYSNCDSDRRHVANVSLILAAPKFKERYTNLLAGGWSLSTIFTARSGGYGTVTTGADTALSGIANQIAVRTGNPYGTRTRFGANGNLVASAFSAPATGTYTATPPLTILGPASYQLDMALLRNFRITESQSVQFRWEVFNVPNEANFLFSATGGTNAQTGAVTSGTFGNFTSAGDPRIMQLALKYLF